MVPEVEPKMDLRFARTVLFSTDDFPLLQKVASEHDVLVEILAKGGESYCQYHESSPDGITGTTCNTLVPEGYVHIRLSSETFELDDFWKTYNSAVEEVKQKIRTSSIR